MINTLTGTHIYVVQSGHRLYKEDGTDAYLEVHEGQAVKSMNGIYMVEQDYARLKQYIDNQGETQ
jgi:hypothetical protein